MTKKTEQFGLAISLLLITFIILTLVFQFGEMRGLRKGMEWTWGNYCSLTPEGAELVCKDLGF